MLSGSPLAGSEALLAFADGAKGGAVWQTIRQSYGYQNIVKHFAVFGWIGVAYELRLLIALLDVITVAIPLTHFAIDRVKWRGPKQ